MPEHTPPFKEFTGLFVAASCVFAFIGIGFVKVFIFLKTGTNVDFSAGWEAAMLSLSSAGLGYLIGRAPGVTSTGAVATDSIVDTATSSTTNTVLSQTTKTSPAQAYVEPEEKSAT